MWLPQNGKTPCYLHRLSARNHPESDVNILGVRMGLPFVLVLPTASFVCDCSGSNWNNLRTPLRSQFETSLTLPDLHLLEGNSHLSKLNPWGFLGSSWSILHLWTQLSLQGFLDFWGTRQSAEQSSCWPCRMGLEPMCSPTGTHPIFELVQGWTNGWLNMKIHFGSRRQDNPSADYLLLTKPQAALKQWTTLTSYASVAVRTEKWPSAYWRVKATGLEGAAKCYNGAPCTMWIVGLCQPFYSTSLHLGSFSFFFWSPFKCFPFIGDLLFV